MLFFLNNLDANNVLSTMLVPYRSVSVDTEPYPYYLDFPLKPASDLEDWRLDTPTTTGRTGSGK